MNLLSDRVIEFGCMPTPMEAGPNFIADFKDGAPASKRGKEPGVNSPESLRVEGEFGHIYVGARRLRIRGNQIHAVANLRMGGPGKIFFFDIPLCGHSMLLAKMRSSSSSDPIFLRMKTIDQCSGEKVGVDSARLLAGKSIELSIPLHGIYGQMAIALEFCGADKMQVTAESIQVR
jgi:hypothetical protein